MESIILLLALVVNTNGAVQQPLVHGGKSSDAVRSVFGGQCTAKAAESGVSSSALVDEQCYFSTTDNNLKWRQAWARCQNLWPGAKLAWFKQPYEQKVDQLRQAGLTGSYRIALVTPLHKEEYFVYNKSVPLPDQTLEGNCNSNVTGKQSVFHDGSCYVYWDEGVTGSNWYQVADKCNGHIPGYKGHLAWPVDSQLPNVLTELVGGLDPDNIYWLGAINEKVSRTSVTDGWQFALNSTHKEQTNGELFSSFIRPWGKGEPNDPLDTVVAAVLVAAVSGIADATIDLSPDKRCRCFSWSSSDDKCRLSTLPCSRTDTHYDTSDISGDSHNLYVPSVEYPQLREVTGLLDTNTGEISKVSPDEFHQALCVKDAPGVATYARVQPGAAGVQTDATPLSTLSGPQFAQDPYAGRECAWHCLKHSACVSFDFSSALQQCKLYPAPAINDNEPAYARHVADDP